MTTTSTETTITTTNTYATVYGYIRVSTNKQTVNGNSLEEQKSKLMAKGVKEKNIFADRYTGTKMDRPAFNKLKEKIKAGDTLMVTKLDRFARTAEEGNQIIEKFISEGIAVHILNMGLMDTTPIGELLRKVVLAFSEFERAMIVERTQEGKAFARKNNPNFKDGRPEKFSKTQQQHAINLIEKEHISYKEVSQMLNISESTLYRIMRNHRAKKITETNK